MDDAAVPHASPAPLPPAGLWLVRLGLAATAVALVGPFVDAWPYPPPLLAAGAFVVLPSVLALGLAFSPRPARLYAGLGIARTIGLAHAVVLGGLLYHQLFVDWPTQGRMVALLATVLGVQLVMGGTAWAMRRRAAEAWAAAPDFGSEAAFSNVGQGMVVLYVLGYLAVPSFSHSPIATRERAVIGNMRTMLSSQGAYSSANRGFYGPVECLVEPPRCLPGYTGPTFLDPGFLQPQGPGSRRSGYVYTFHPVPAAGADAPRTPSGAPATLTRYAWVAVPEVPGRSGVRAFCADDSGLIRQSPDGVMPPVVDARCPQSLPNLP